MIEIPWFIEALKDNGSTTKPREDFEGIPQKDATELTLRQKM